jgi:hypothetical protein
MKHSKTCNGSQAEFKVYMVDPFTLQEAVAGHLPSWRIDALLWETSETRIEQARSSTWVHQGKQSATGAPSIAKACYDTVVDESQISQCWVSLWLTYPVKNKSSQLVDQWKVFPIQLPTHPSLMALPVPVVGSLWLTWVGKREMYVWLVWMNLHCSFIWLVNNTRLGPRNWAFLTLRACCRRRFWMCCCRLLRAVDLGLCVVT